MSNLEQLTAQSVAFHQKAIEYWLLKKFFPFDTVANHISPVHMHMWIVTYIVHDSSTCNIALSSVVWSSQFNTKISKITAKLYFIVCHQHPCHSKELLFYLIWIQKHFIFDLFFRYQQFMKMFQAMEMKIPQG
jgi:hypothetical protein